MTQVAIVTGAAQGIGRAIALVGVNDVWTKSSELDELVAQIQLNGGQVVSVPADVATEAEVDEMVKQTVDSFGALYVMVANAGARVPGEPLLQMSDESFDTIMSTNVKGTLYSYRAAARQMIKQGPERG